MRQVPLRKPDFMLSLPTSVLRITLNACVRVEREAGNDW